MSFRYLKIGHYPDQFAAMFSGRQIGGYSIVNTYGPNNSEISASDIGSYQSEMIFRTGPSQDNNWHVIKIDMDLMRSILGQSPILLAATLTFWSKNSSTITHTIEAFRMLTEPDWTDMTWRYRDGPSTTTWEHDIYGPASGDDHRSVPFFQESITFPTGSVWGTELTMDVLSELRFFLRSNLDMKFLLRAQPNASANKTIYSYWDRTGYLPYFELRYLNPIEFFSANDDGTINLADIAIETDDLDDSLYIGALQRGETGTPVQVWMKNLSEVTFPLVEVWDDFPEWTEPEHTAGSGTGSLDYVVLLENAESQRYTIDFYSTTEYEVKAESFRDNTESMHPAIDADASWRGTTGTDFSAPEGGLTIPAAAWQASGLTAADEFTVLVLGNTTDTAWPADSNDMVEVTADVGGSPDASGWRPIAGRRTQLRAAVTVDAATKKFYVRPITASHWTIGDPCFVGNDTTVDEGTIKTVSEASIGTDSFTGSGLDDLTLSGNYNGTWDNTLRIEIDGTGTPDTFKWSKDGGSTWEATGVSITGSAQLLSDGIYVTFAATTGHTSTDYWDSTITPWTIEVESLSAGSNSYSVGDRVGTTLPFQSLATSVHALTNAASGVSQTPANRIYIDDPVTEGFTAGSKVTVTNAAATQHETGTIATAGVTSTYIELEADLTKDFASGSFCLQAGEGEAAFWVRVDADISSTEELKQFKINVRT